MAAQPKKRPKAEKAVDPEKVEAKTTKDLVEEHMVDMLKSSGNARSQSLKLEMVAYGKDLSDELLKYAVAVEHLFKKLQEAVNAGDEKLMSKLLKDAKEKHAQGEKAKARTNSHITIGLYIHYILHTYIHTYMHTYIHTYMYTYIHTYIHTYIRTYMPTYMHTYIHTYIHTKNTYIHTPIHIYLLT